MLRGVLRRSEFRWWSSSVFLFGRHHASGKGGDTARTLPVMPADAWRGKPANGFGHIRRQAALAHVEFMRRPASPDGEGMAAVMAVSMKPGATALMVMPFADTGALLCTMPTTPPWTA